MENTKNTYGMNLYIENQDKDVWIKFNSTRETMLEATKTIEATRPIDEDTDKKSEEAHLIEILEILSSKVDDLRIFFSEEALRKHDRKEWEETQKRVQEECKEDESK